MNNQKSIHITLPMPVYEKLRQISKDLNITATEIARSAITEWLKNQEQLVVHHAIIEFASEFGGTEYDLDQDLESAGLEVLQIDQ